MSPLQVIAEKGNREIEREKMLEVLNRGLPNTRIQTIYKNASPSQKVFITYFKKIIFPTLQEFKKLGFIISWNQVAIDRALYNNIEEKSKWQNNLLSAMNQYDALKNGKAWKLKVTYWSRLAKNLPGELPKLALSLNNKLKIEAFGPETIPILNKISKLNIEVNDIANSSPFGDNLSEVNEKIDFLVSQYRHGKIELKDASRQILEARENGERGLSRDIESKAGERLNELAKLRTKLAKLKGYSSWAAYQVAVQSFEYSEPFDSLSGRIDFLESLLTATEATLEKVLVYLAKKDEDLSRDSFNQSQLKLILPEAQALLSPYLKKEELDSIWKKANLESGFSEKDLDHLIIDSMPRTNKYQHAYMMSLLTPTPKTLTLRAATGSSDRPLEDHFYHPGLSYILQNYFTGGVEDLRVAFHEGGHGTHFLKELNTFSEDHAYGYVEVHSILMEHFMLDPDFLQANLKDKNQLPPTPETLETYLSNSKINQLFDFRVLVGRALFELLLWSHDFTDDSTTYTDQSNQLWDKVITRASGVLGTANHGVDYTGRGPLNAPHFREAWVNYMGYVVAQVGASASIETLLDAFEEENGRRTFNQQPTLSRRLIEGYYHSGFQMKFPDSVVNFTKRPFDALEFSRKINEDLQDIGSCEHELSS